MDAGTQFAARRLKMAQNGRMRWLETLDPGYFVMTMATGIISIAFQALEMPVLSDALYLGTLFSWCVLFFLYAWRLLRYPGAVWADLINTRRTFNFFSFVAGTCVTGMLLHAHGHVLLALISWIAAFIAWSGLLYCSFGALILLHPERSAGMVHGGWLICIVGTQSLVLLGLKIVPGLTDYAEHMMVVIFMLWGLGLILYGILVTLISNRIFFSEMKKDDYTPRMWVIMGAAAITANASSALDMADPVINVLYEVHSVIDAVAMLTWAWASWWIPLLVIIGVWRHAVQKVPLRYEPSQWSIAFPLGMYTVASMQLSLAAEFAPLHLISHVMVWAAAGVWALLMIGLWRRIAAWSRMKAQAVEEA